MVTKKTGAGEAAPRTRLIPPRVGAVERKTRLTRDAQRWSANLRGTQRRRLMMLLGNLLLLSVLVGLPFLRGQRRAQAAERAHAALLGCLYGARVRGGLGEFARERDYFAALLARDPKRLTRCLPSLDALSEPPALFVLPSVKRAEARVREALAFVRTELTSAALHEPGARMPERAVRALALLREMLREQRVVSDVDAAQVSLPLVLERAESLPTPARLPLYAAADAVVSVAGDDQTLRVTALDSSGLSYLEAEAGKPFSRARLVRPSLLRAFVSHEHESFLVWGTKAERCAERANGCFGKSTSVAQITGPLLALPTPRSLAAHLSGRADRSLASQRDGLLVAARSASGRVALQEFAWSPELTSDAALPALPARSTWARELDEAVVLSSADQPLVLGLVRGADKTELVRPEKSSSATLATLPANDHGWLTACTTQAGAQFAFGAGGQVVLGALTRDLTGTHTQLWPALPLALTNVIDAEHENRDRAVSVCTGEGALLVMRERDQLAAIVCKHDGSACQRLSLARGVDHFSVLASEHGVLVAYAGEESAQVRVRAIINADAAKLGPERVPAACWSTGGLCRKPTLARLGRRVILLAPDKTDQLALESADDGEHWTTPAVL